MLEKLPPAIGRTLRRVRPGLDSILTHRKGLVTGAPTITVESPAFRNEEALPARFTADGDGLSPPLRWTNVPAGTRSIVVIVEDADSPTLLPLVHGIVAKLPPTATEITEGTIAVRDGGPVVGRNSFFRTGWLPPDPPPGHGPHRYAFQVIALDHEPDLGAHPGRSALVRTIQGHTLAYGMIIGTYAR